MGCEPGLYHELDVYQGDTLEFEVTYTEGESGYEVGKSLTGATIASEIKLEQGSGATVTTMTCTADADQTANPGVLTVVLPAANSALLTERHYWYDVEVTWADATVQTILWGRITTTQGVTN